MRFLSLLFLLLVTLNASASAASVEELTSEIDRKISVSQAKGELTGRQIITFKERLQKLCREKKETIEMQRDLVTISAEIDNARKPRRVANRFFRWWQ